MEVMKIDEVKSGEKTPNTQFNALGYAQMH